MGMKSVSPYGKELGGCGLVGIIERSGKRLPAGIVVTSLCYMKERGNGLGSGYAVYGAYPEFKGHHCLHLMFTQHSAIKTVEELLQRFFLIIHSEPIPTRKINSIFQPPEFLRYFVKPKPGDPDNFKEEDLIVKIVMDINENIDGAYVVSSGKDMAVFKGVGQPDEIADFFRLEDYSGYMLIGHTRFPTNTPGWWGGAHPFTILDWSIVHNGELSSYGTNKRFVEMFGYKCTLLTDTEVVAYLLDYLVRKKGLSLVQASTVLAPPFWKDIDRMPAEEKKYHLLLRTTFGNASLNGPFAIVMGFNGGMMGLNDRVKLRPLIVGVKSDIAVMASEESAIREIVKNPDDIWSPEAGSPVIFKMKEIKRKNG